ncbi:UTP--glucose-1-phosphate uridylyltransferase [uncultured Candidatus Thioglobus sp.]|nr:UTP--glucose-1-phosphate uridylyltransferase [uncultured Candidatus Thioglobus sp.]
MTQKIRKALFPVAGLGTRFLPATKASAKEMLPIVDKPLIQYAVEEAVAAGITQLIFIMGRTKRSIADHFDKAYELEMELQKYNKTDLLPLVQNIVPKNVCCMHIRQAEPLGLGHAVLCGRAAIGDEPFAVLLADDLIDAGECGCLSKMIDVFTQKQRSVIAVADIPREEVYRYGVISSSEIEQQISKLNGIVEKPSPANAPSTKAVVGRYILTPKIFAILEYINACVANAEQPHEVQLTDAVAELLQEEPVYGYAFDGKRYDCGSKLGYLQAVVEYAVKHPELGHKFSEYLAGRD